MSQASVWTRREVWTRKLLYPGHTLPTAAAPVIVAIGLAVHDRVFAAPPVALAFLAGWLIQFAGVVTDNYSNLKREPDDREHPELVQAVNSGLLSLADLRNTILVSYGLALLLGFALMALAGWPVIVIGLASTAPAPARPPMTSTTKIKSHRERAIGFPFRSRPCGSLANAPTYSN